MGYKKRVKEEVRRQGELVEVEKKEMILNRPFFYLKIYLSFLINASSFCGGKKVTW